MITKQNKRAIQVMFYDLKMSSYEIANDFWRNGIDILYKDVFEITKRETSLSGHPLRKRTIYFNGEEKTVDEWSRITGLTKNAIYSRLIHGWTVKDALSVGVPKRINTVSRRIA